MFHTVRTPASSSVGTGFISIPGGWLNRLMVFPCTSRQISGLCLKLGHDRFLPYSFHLIIHCHNNPDAMVYMLSY